MSVPVTISSNITGLSFAEESTLGVLPVTPIWFALEPNTYADFGATFTSIARETINATRQVLKGTITDLKAKGGFNIDMTQHNLQKLLQGFFYANIIEKPDTAPINGTAIPITSTTTTEYVASGGGLSVFLANMLIFAENFINSANNGLKQVASSATGEITPTGGGLVVETPPATAQIQACGYRATAGDLALSISGSFVLLSSTTLNFTTLGLNVGEWIYLGGDAAANAFATAADTGYCRIYSIAANVLTFDLTSFTPVADSGAGKLIDIYFGKVLMNATTSGNIVVRSYNLERTLGNDGTGTQVEYLIGAVADTCTINVKDASKLTTDLSYVALNIADYTGATGVKSGTRVAALGEAAFNTSQNVYLSRLAPLNPSTLNPTAEYAYLQDLTIDIKNDVIANTAIGTLGGFSVNEGDFAVTGKLTAYFATVGAVAAIAANQSFCLQTILAQANAGFVFDIPQLTLGGGENKVAKDKPIMVDLTMNASKNANGYTMLSCFFQYLPTVAM
jgi:tail tube protein